MAFREDAPLWEVVWFFLIPCLGIAACYLWIVYNVEKFGSFLSHPRKSIAYRLRFFLPLINLYCKWRLSNVFDISLFRLRPPGAIKPVYSDLWFLYQHIRKNRYTSVLEYGSGCSTPIIAQAISDNGYSEKNFISIDDDRYWLGQTQRIIPQHLSFTQLFLYEKFPMDTADGRKGWVLPNARYPLNSPQFIYLDGPTFEADRKILFVPLDFLLSVSLDSILVDGREENVQEWKDNMDSSQYRFKSRWLFNNTLITRKNK